LAIRLTASKQGANFFEQSQFWQYYNEQSTTKGEHMKKAIEALNEKGNDRFNQAMSNLQREAVTPKLEINTKLRNWHFR
jgi:hypothetical protein